MKKFMCVICGHVYDESLGWPEDGIAPGTPGQMSLQTGAAPTVVQERRTLRWRNFSFVSKPRGGNFKRVGQPQAIRLAPETALEFR